MEWENIPIREVEVALPVELSRAEQLALVRAYVKDNFVSAGMCADFAIHDKGTGNPHAHIMLTIRPLKEDGTWGAKYRNVYDLDGQGQRIPDGKGGWKSHREDTTDWNQRGNAEKWRAAWAAYTNRALEAAGRPERIDHRSYKRQGVDKIPTVHMGPAASQMERRGIQTENSNLKNNLSGVSESARIWGRYGNVFLTEAEVAELQVDFPTVWQEYVERLSEYMASTGKTYKSHAATIRRWAKEDRRKGKGVSDYSCKEGESL